MLRTRLTALGAFAFVFTGWFGLTRDSLEGEWEIVSVQRNAAADPMQVGARMRFEGNRVTFQPRAIRFDDVSSAATIVAVDTNALARRVDMAFS